MSSPKYRNREGDLRLEMSSHKNTPSVNDLRQALVARRYVVPSVSPQDLPVDYAGFIAVAGVMFRFRWPPGVAAKEVAQKEAAEATSRVNNSEKPNICEALLKSQV